MIMAKPVRHANDAFAKDETIVLRAVLRLARRLRRAAGDSELTEGALALLASLHRQGATSAVDLARREGLQPQSLSRLLARLDADGLIIRAVDTVDRRRQVIAATPRGVAALRRSMKLRRDWLADAMAERLDATERKALLNAALLMLRMAD
jgi:DNA-binding MarR family transcriptional regulator